jgi:hypothetical protein
LVNAIALRAKVAIYLFALTLLPENESPHASVEVLHDGSNPLDYKILSEISRGDMEIVYRALDLKLDREGEQKKSCAERPRRRLEFGPLSRKPHLNGYLKAALAASQRNQKMWG